MKLVATTLGFYVGVRILVILVFRIFGSKSEYGLKGTVTQDYPNAASRFAGADLSGA